MPGRMNLQRKGAHIMEDNAIIQKFLDYLKFDKRFSGHTAKCHGADVVQFGGFILRQ